MTKHLEIPASAETPHVCAYSSCTRIMRFVRAWMASCREFYAAAATYEQLSRLSDAELTRRGLSRETLARDLCGLRDDAREGRSGSP